jgi:hypothetical protein
VSIHIHNPPGFVRRYVRECPFELRRRRLVAITVPYYEVTWICCGCGFTGDTERGAHLKPQDIKRWNGQRDKARHLWATAPSRAVVNEMERECIFGAKP